MNKKTVLVAALLALSGGLQAMEFEGGAKKEAPAQRASSLPRLIEAGDAPTAYGLLKYELRADLRFYPGGGVLSKLALGIFPRFFIGGGLNLPGLVSAGPVPLTREDASLLARVVAIEEDASFPAVALGWDGPAYDGSELRGMYLSASKEFSSPLGYFQAHGGLNNGYFLEDWKADRHLRGFAALSSAFRQLIVFFEADEIGHVDGPRLNGGGRVFFDPISVGIEFRGIGATRPNQATSRMLRVSYSGLF